MIQSDADWSDWLDLPWWHMMVQSAVSLAFPSQGFPFTGGGLVQVRVRVSMPLPHSLLHSLHLLHEDQPPFSETHDIT